MQNLCLINYLIFQVCLNAEQDELANKTETNYVCWGLSGFSSINRASPHQGKDLGSISEHWTFSALLETIQPSIEFSKSHTYGLW